MAWSDTTHVPTRLRTACLQRDGNQCTAIQQDGQRCPETTNLEADHINGWHQNEHLTVDMLQTLCTWHHQRKTAKEAATARRKQPNWQQRAQRPTPKHPGLA